MAVKAAAVATAAVATAAVATAAVATAAEAIASATAAATVYFRDMIIMSCSICNELLIEFQMRGLKTLSTM